MHQLDAAGAILRVALGVVMLAHGWNHLYGPGGVDGTARWFGSMGLKPGGNSLRPVSMMWCPAEWSFEE